MVNIENKCNCTGCSACAAACPRKCIEMREDQEGFLYPKIDAAQCVRCGVCEQVCPVLSEKPGQIPDAYATVNLNEETLSQSSSGGIFSLLASSILDKGGVVFGAALTSDGRVAHTAVHTPENLSALRGSKYVQSDIGNTYREAKDLLEKGVPVYFSGTPCQIAGLLKFLKRDYPHLLTQDLVCHGVPSPLVFRKYMEYQKENHGAAPKSVLFRKKHPTIKPYALAITFENGSVYESAPGADPYMKAFLRNVSLRPSCYDCRFKSAGRVSDITLADYWGIDKVHPEFSSEDGVSLVFLHSEKGKRAFAKLEGRVRAIRSNAQEAIAHNPSAVESSKCPAGRGRFFRALSRKSFPEAVEKGCKDSLVLRLKKKAKSLIKKIIR